MAGGSGGQAPQQYAVTTGPTVDAANSAAAAQINAAQMAAQAATQNTNKAISALMNSYGTALRYAQPSVNTGNQALAQMNYMMGLPAVSPGNAPVAPRAQTTQDSLYSTPEWQSLSNTAQGLGRKYGLDIRGAPGPSGWNSPSGSATGIASIANALNGTQYATREGQNFANQLSRYGTTAGGSGADLVNAALAQDQARFEQENIPYQQQLDQYNQQKSVYDQYAAKGTLAPEQLTTQIENLPGYRFNFNQGISAIQNAASASGQLNSGALLRNLNEFGQGIASSYYNNYLSQLGALAGFGQTTTQNVMGGSQNVGNQMANQYTNLGNNQANAYLAAGQAQASSFLSPAANQQVISTPIGSQGGGSSGANLGSALGMLGSIGSLFGGGGGGFLGGMF